MDDIGDRQSYVVANYFREMVEDGLMTAEGAREVDEYLDAVVEHMVAGNINHYDAVMLIADIAAEKMCERFGGGYKRRIAS